VDAECFLFTLRMSFSGKEIHCVCSSRRRSGRRVHGTGRCSRRRHPLRECAGSALGAYEVTSFYCLPG
jgi:hypothetical protein